MKNLNKISIMEEISVVFFMISGMLLLNSINLDIESLIISHLCIISIPFLFIYLKNKEMTDEELIEKIFEIENKK